MLHSCHDEEVGPEACNKILFTYCQIYSEHNVHVPFLLWLERKTRKHGYQTRSWSLSLIFSHDINVAFVKTFVGRIFAQQK